MRILMLTPYLPYPLLSGGQTRSYNLLKNLGKKHQITLFSFIRKDEERTYRKHLLTFCTKVEVFKRRKAWSILNILLSAFSPYPFLVAIYLSHSVRRALTRELATNNYDLIHAETFYVMPNIPKTEVPILLVEQTIEYRVYQHFVEKAVPAVIKPLLWIDVWKVRFWEKYFWAQANRVVAMSEVDRAKMLNVLPNLTVDIVPNGVDTETFQSGKMKANKNPLLLYVGNFKWLQNREAATILIKEVWPKIKKKMPLVQLLIVGRGVTRELKRLGQEDIVFDDTVEDIRNSYQQADLMIAPILGPGGTRLKILEAMASSCPVVTTPVGIEGIAARHKKEVLVGNTPWQLAKYAIEVLQDGHMRTQLTIKAQQLVSKRYDWVNITKKLDRIYHDVSYGKKG